MYSRAPVSTDSVSAVYRCQKKDNYRNKRLIGLEKRAKRERAVKWWDPAAQARSVPDSSSFVPVPKQTCQNPLLSYVRERERMYTVNVQCIFDHPPTELTL
jgi:hypothetical protein